MQLADAYARIDAAASAGCTGSTSRPTRSPTASRPRPRSAPASCSSTATRSSDSRAVDQDRLTLVPLAIYFKDGRAKVELALARGRKKDDKRQAMAERDADRDMDRAIGRRRKGMRVTALSQDRPPASRPPEAGRYAGRCTTNGADRFRHRDPEAERATRVAQTR